MNLDYTQILFTFFNFSEAAMAQENTNGLDFFQEYGIWVILCVPIFLLLKWGLGKLDKLNR